ncbi:MAG TPA: DUF4337 family protein [Chthoniobacterales bacterium]|jgi:hypothetical protein
MEEAEIPLEHLHEQIQERAEHGTAQWISWVALSTAILAVLAAIAALLSGSHANEAMMSEIDASDQWGFYQAKSIKAAVLEAKSAQSSAAIAADKEKAASYQKEEVAIKAEAERKQGESRAHFHKHEVYARSVTLFQIAIAIAAISALTQRRSFWGVSLLAGVVGLVFFILGIAAR